MLRKLVGICVCVAGMMAAVLSNSAPTEPTRPAGPVAGDDLARAEEEEEDGPARPRNQRMTLKTMRQAKERKQEMVAQ
eukprot:COSAG01_NODE_72081_length_254_cov_0.651613_1_plen_77_part_01